LKVVFSYCPVVSGVPQGSGLGPILSLIYINDVDSACKGSSILQLSADDAKLYSRVSVDDCTNFLQLSLDSLSAWADQWQLAIKINKCSVLHIALKTHHSSSNYLINGTQIPVHNSCVDLGVITNDDLSFRDHINIIVSKAQQRTGVLLRGFVSRRLDIMRTAFVAYVRPLLEYNSVVWNPSQKQFIDLIENVQHSFTKRIPSLSPLL
jgi:ribonuclease P/MRP protein subunit RPP40